jgi:hypothetical protein
MTIYQSITPKCRHLPSAGFTFPSGRAVELTMQQAVERFYCLSGRRHGSSSDPPFGCSYPGLSGRPAWWCADNDDDHHPGTRVTKATESSSRTSQRNKQMLTGSGSSNIFLYSTQLSPGPMDTGRTTARFKWKRPVRPARENAPALACRPFTRSKLKTIYSFFSTKKRNKALPNKFFWHR